MTLTDRIATLQKAREAANAVLQEIERQNDADLTSSGPERREPVRQRAKNQIRLIDIEIRNLTAAGNAIALDPLVVDRLDVLAARLDQAIQINALIDLGTTSLIAVLNAVSEVRETLA
ncbi:hypothetical protein F183_A12980 [Bryobacterales bacterium F-183]|nr:hypothetical protein F183_A12980 [Bryobacterales bacterium F-183]